MYEFNLDILRFINNPPTGVGPTAPLGAIFMASSMELGLLLSDASKRDFMLTYMYVRFAETVSGAGQPVQVAYDATYLAHSIYKTYAAARDYSAAGISVHAVVAAGDYGIIQVGGLNGWAIAGATAAAAGDVGYISATNAVSAAATDANRLKKLGVYERIQAGAGAIPVGEFCVGKSMFSC